MDEMERLLENSGFGRLADAGYHLALRVGFAFPEFERNTLPRAWVDRYTRQGLMLFDPVIRWIYDNTGTTRWSEIDVEDERGVLAAASEYDLRFGAAVSIMDEQEVGLRSFGSFARADRDFTDSELALLAEAVANMHGALQPTRVLTNAEIEALHLLSAGLMLKEVAHRLGISESAVKLRISNARVKMNARTTMQAVSIAKQYGWI
ncbi:helix-turn-helix transcriptional regulator [Oceaniglobus roseus]|uniref:helix-turn-helix transcriptional regulator n=1 Tax=Oceaniglobus roseus TaxID=1737570 RepID=UPI001FEBE41A|nr:LuxR family transcriptional regulator [Kandeliimicrobium roseum]